MRDATPSLRDANPPPDSRTAALPDRVEDDFRVAEIQRLRLLTTLEPQLLRQEPAACCPVDPDGEGSVTAGSSLLRPVALSGRRSQHPSLSCLTPQNPLKGPSQWQEPRERPATAPPCSPMSACHSRRAVSRAACEVWGTRSSRHPCCDEAQHTH